MPAPEAYEFGACVLDVAERRLSRDGAAVPLAPKAFDLLVVLVRRAGALVTKQQLLELVWPDAHVEEGILAVHVSNLRTALGDRSCIETVSRAGYRFTGAVSPRRGRPAGLSMRWPVGVLPAEPAVHELVGRGRAHLLSTSRAEIPQAVEAFRAAIALDPSYAPAHAGLARACCAQAELRLVPHAEAYAEARAEALRSLAMHDDSADAQTALGAVMLLSDWNWLGARRSLERALALDPHHVEACLLYGRLADAFGEFDRGMAARRRALEHDAPSVLVHIQIAQSWWNQRRYDEVISWARRALALDARHLLAREFLAGAYWGLGDADRHLAESLAHAEAAGVPAETLEEIRRINASGGRRALVEHTLAHLPDRPACAFQKALLLGELGRMDAAFLQLDAAIDQRDPCLVHLAVAPQWDVLRPDPRFETRVAGMGLRASPFADEPSTR